MNKTRQVWDLFRRLPNGKVGKTKIDNLGYITRGKRLLFEYKTVFQVARNQSRFKGLQCAVQKLFLLKIEALRMFNFKQKYVDFPNFQSLILQHSWLQQSEGAMVRASHEC